ncbi:hypothetical protein WIW50_19420 [Flavobacteriaceae bacterium 3-367]
MKSNGIFGTNVNYIADPTIKELETLESCYWNDNDFNPKIRLPSAQCIDS